MFLIFFVILFIIWAMLRMSSLADQIINEKLDKR